MKLQAKSYLIVAMMAAAVLTGCATGPADKAAQESAADRVLAAYDVPDLLAQAAPAVTQSLNQNLPDDVDAATRSTLRDAVYEAYDPATLQQDVLDRLRDAAAKDDQQRALTMAADALHTPLATRMISLESATGDPNFAENFKAFVDQPATDERKQRLRQIDLLAKHMQIVELQTDFNVTLLEAMIRARNVASAEEYRVDNSRVEQMVAETRANIGNKLEQRVPLMLLYVYRNVEDSTLADYAALQGQPELVWTNQALKSAIIDTLAAASDRVTENFNSAS
ncbi:MULTISPECIES: hypothetical protein [unclassified Salinisphaera]|uniref:hypothetical protein n=1 Tax=unclassified Salinisphaera TaxID=2649847 RepID=UPI0033408DDF